MTRPSLPPLHALHQALAVLRRGIRRRASLEGFLSGLPVGLAVLLVGAWAMGRGALEPEQRWWILGVATLSLLLPATWRMLQAWQQSRSDQLLAARLETSFPELRTDLRTLLEFSSQAPTDDPVAQELRTHLGERMRPLIRNIVPFLPRAIPRRSLRLHLGALGVVLLLGVLSPLLHPGALRAGTRLLLGSASSVEDALPRSAVPLVGTFDLEITPPAYTGMRSELIFGSTGDIEALPGSTIKLRARALIPLSELILRTEMAGEVDRIRLTLSETGAVEGTFVVREDGKWTLEATREDGERVRDPLEHRIRVLRDTPPRIELQEPEEFLEVTPEHVIDFLFVAGDDFGLGAMELVWHFEGDPERERRQTVANGGGARSWEGHVPLDLVPLRLQPRDTVIVFIEAFDNDTIHGPKAGRSREVTLRVASADDRHDQVLELKEEIFEQLLRALANDLAIGLHAIDRQVASPELRIIPAPATPEERGQRVAQVRQSQAHWEEIHTLFSNLLELMQEDALSDEMELQDLEALQQRLSRARQEVTQALNSFPAAADSRIQDERSYRSFAQALIERMDGTERVLLLMQDFIATHRAEDVTRAMQELGQARQDLRELLERYRDTQDPELREQIEEDLRRLERRMRELMERIASQVDELPVEHLNADALEPSNVAEGLQQMGSALDQLRSLLDQGDIDGALAALDQLAQEMDGLDRELSPLGASQPDTLSEFDSRMGEMIDELNDLEALEQAIQEDTEALQEQIAETRDSALEDRLRQTIERQRERLEELRQLLNRASGQGQSSDNEQLLNEAQETIGSLEARLDEGDIANALEFTDRLEAGLNDLIWNIEMESWRSTLTPIVHFLPQLRDSREVPRSIRRDLEALLEASRPKPNAQQRQQLSELAQRQAAGRERLGQIREQAQELRQRFPSSDQGTGQTLQEIGGHMEAAENRLDSGDVRGALPQEGAALEGIRRARQQMQQQLQQQRQQDRRERGRSQSERVEIPQDDNSDGRQLRQRIIESMRDDHPEGYEEQIRQYYERLLE